MHLCNSQYPFLQYLSGTPQSNMADPASCTEASDLALHEPLTLSAPAFWLHTPSMLMLVADPASSSEAADLALHGYLNVSDPTL